MALRRSGSGVVGSVCPAALAVACIAGVSLGDAIVVPEDAATIQGAIVLAGEQGVDEVRVLPGTYFERVEFGASALTLRGVGGPGETIIDATGLGGAAVLVGPSTPSVVIDGFTITGGTSAGVNVDQSSITIQNSVLSGNSGGLGGGLSTWLSDVTLEGVVFSGNSAAYGGGASIIHSGVSAKDVEFVDNTATQFGGGLYVNGANVDMRGLGLIDNGSAQPTSDGSGTIYFTGGGGGAYITGSDGLVAGVRATGNAAAFGGAFYFAGDGSVEVVNALMRANSGGTGIVYANASSPVLTNVSIVDNAEASSNTFGIFTTFNAEPVVRNSVIANNWPVAESGGNGVTTFTNVIVDGQIFSAIDDGVMQMDPLLDEDGRPQAGSPAIDAGANSAVPAGVLTDLDGNARFVDDPDTADSGEGTAPIVDLGAFEFQVESVGTDCAVDMDQSGVVDAIDLGMLLGRFGSSVPAGAGGDLNGDGVVDSLDLGIMLGWFGQACE